MIHDISQPQISTNFTIDDIHKIREWHFEPIVFLVSEIERGNPFAEEIISTGLELV
jgi:hypothetical protein